MIFIGVLMLVVLWHVLGMRDETRGLLRQIKRFREELAEFRKQLP